MQFQLNGVRPGAPDVHPASDDAAPDAPPGLTQAARMAAFQTIETCMVERKPGPLDKGRADGIACRSTAMFDAFGVARQVLREACLVNDTTFWTPAPAAPRAIARAGRLHGAEDGPPEFPHVILNQARAHDFFLEVMGDVPARMVPDRQRAAGRRRCGRARQGIPCPVSSKAAATRRGLRSDARPRP